LTITIYIEGGGDSKELHTRCREGFRNLLEKCGYIGKMPKLVACGGRGSAFSDFKTAHRGGITGDFDIMLIDSEDPMTDIEAAWNHLRKRDNWETPEGATDDQVLFMTTCMETWIITDHQVLKDHYGSMLQVSALPSLINLEERGRHEVQNKIAHATRNCKNSYKKGQRSFEVLAKLTPDLLKQHLPSFERNIEILNQNILGIERNPKK